MGNEQTNVHLSYFICPSVCLSFHPGLYVCLSVTYYSCFHKNCQHVTLTACSLEGIHKPHPRLSGTVGSLWGLWVAGTGGEAIPVGMTDITRTEFLCTHCRSFPITHPHHSPHHSPPITHSITHPPSLTPSLTLITHPPSLTNMSNNNSTNMDCKIWQYCKSIYISRQS